MSTFEFTFLGTGAADFPFPFPENSFDSKARRSTCNLLNGNTLIDFGVHGLKSLEILNKDFSEIENIIISHIHSDHFNIENIGKIAAKKNKPLNLFVSKGVKTKFEIPENVIVTEMERFKEYKIGDLLVTGVPANHDPNIFPQHLIIEKDGKKIFYGPDGAWLLNESYYFMKDKKFDLMILDATCGDYAGDFRMAEHNSIPMIRLMLASFKTMNITCEKSRVFLSHIAPSLHKSNEELSVTAKEMGCELAFDGMTVEI